MEEKITLLGCIVVILSSPFLGVPSFSLTLQVCFFLLTEAVFSTTLLFLVKVTAFLSFPTADLPCP